MSSQDLTTRCAQSCQSQRVHFLLITQSPAFLFALHPHLLCRYPAPLPLHPTWFFRVAASSSCRALRARGQPPWVSAARVGPCWAAHWGFVS